MGILDSIFAGAVTGGGAAMENVYQRRDEADIRSKLEEQKAKADFDRQTALQRMQNDYTTGRDATQAGYQSKRDETQAGYQTARDAMHNEFQTGRDTRQNEFTSGENAKRLESDNLNRAESRADRLQMAGIASADRAAARADAREWRAASLEQRKAEMNMRDGAALDKLPQLVQLDYKANEDRIKGASSELSKIYADMRDPMKGQGPGRDEAMKRASALEAQVKQLNKQQMGIRIRHDAVDIDNEAAKLGQIIKSPADYDTSLKQMVEVGGKSYRDKVVASMDSQGLTRESFAKSEPASEPSAGPIGPSNRPPTGKSAPAAGILGTAMSAPSGQRTSDERRADERAASDAAADRQKAESRAQAQANKAKYDALTPSAISQMGPDEVRNLLNNRRMLDGEQITAATNRLKQIQGR